MTHSRHARARLLLLICGTLLGLAACGGGSSDSLPSLPAGVVAPPPLDPGAVGVVETAPYQGTGTYASNLRDCTYAGINTETCTLAELPFIGQKFTAPTVEDVLDRTLVSHTWMGDNFRTLLGLLPADMLELFRSVTAIVIASDVRPAYYDPNTGAIYLDPDFLWFNVAEAAVIDQTPDFRAEFGVALAFDMPWRYVRNNQGFQLNLDIEGNRDSTEVSILMGFLLYHELAHANDFMHPSRMPNLDSGQTAASYLTSGLGYLSNSFETLHGNQSQVMKDLAGVSFFGDSPTQAQVNTQPVDLVNEFANDRAVQYYAYANQFEDFATTFETIMMAYHFGYDKDVAITANIADINGALVTWGERGRIGSQLLNAKTLATVQAMDLSNNSAVQTFLNGLPLPTPMRTTDTWSGNLNLSAPGLPPLLQINGASGPLRKGGGVDDILARVRIR